MNQKQSNPVDSTPVVDISQDPEAQQALEPFRQLLLKKKQVLTETAGSLAKQALLADSPQGMGELSSVPTHPANQASGASDQLRQLTIVQREEGELSEIEDALNRIRAGSYGICEDCDEPIPRRRLEVLPEARFCIACEEEFESQVQQAQLATGNPNAIADDFIERMDRPGRIQPSLSRSHNPDLRYTSIPVTRSAGTRDTQRDYGNLYERGTPPLTNEENNRLGPEGGPEEGPEGGREYNGAFGRGGYPASFYGRDASPETSSDEASASKGGDENVDWRKEAPAGTETDNVAYFAQEEGDQIPSDSESDSDNDSDDETLAT